MCLLRELLSVLRTIENAGTSCSMDTTLIKISHYKNNTSCVNCFNSICEMKTLYVKINFHMRMFHFICEIRVSYTKISHVN